MQIVTQFANTHRHSYSAPVIKPSFAIYKIMSSLMLTVRSISKCRFVWQNLQEIVQIINYKLQCRHQRRQYVKSFNLLYVKCAFMAVGIL